MERKKKATNLTAEARIIRGLEQFADDLDSGKDISELYTCRKVALNLEPVEYTPEMVKQVRMTLGVSQTLFAQFIGASLSNVQKWERGEREPSPMACRFMDELMFAPDQYRKRFLDLATPVGSSLKS